MMRHLTGRLAERWTVRERQTGREWAQRMGEKQKSVTSSAKMLSVGYRGVSGRLTVLTGSDPLARRGARVPIRAAMGSGPS